MVSTFELTQGTWQERLEYVVAMMREMSGAKDPQKMVEAYAARVRKLLPGDRWMAISRRGLEPPKYRITRSSIWPRHINPWKEQELLPVYDRGLLQRLLYEGEPRIISRPIVDPDDPAAEHLADMQSLLVIPHFEGGRVLNMVITGSRDPDAFDHERLPEMLWLSNLFGRATHNLVLSDQVQAAYAAVDHELQIVADIQRSLLPKAMPRVPTLDFAVNYQTSRRAGGDYYDFFEVPGGKLGIFLADASGHGTPATVMMAITHSIAHSFPGAPQPPGAMLAFLNAQLTSRYTVENDSFVTAFYGIYDPATRVLNFALAGHNPPRWRRSDGTIQPLGEEAGLPLGVRAGEEYPECSQNLAPGDTVLFYTDGVTEASSDGQIQFGVEGLDKVLYRPLKTSAEILVALKDALEEFTGGQAPEDDRTVLAIRVKD
ncbi:MAG TPA: GAF domain-containing SpoIIE family protein phosphatase [Pirellulales bacterium]|nr:GAF domain-containing SpoIIE family protein phosphatase [Pirellulales bacterium]